MKTGRERDGMESKHEGKGKGWNENIKRRKGWDINRKRRMGRNRKRRLGCKQEWKDKI